MIASILQKISEGSYSTPELAASVGLSPEQLKNRLFFLERQGYITRGEDCMPEGGACGSCALCPSCTDKNRSMLPVQYRLTRKGELLARRKMPRT
ncbi:winged helix-turn-helix transcriptional regulator [Methanoregula sp.]|uniref:winged helix-turn-helix transcriptional regulator n=1 Tax=Methanoregula sp. TaxID=2052170 RepID=UPI003BB0C6EF